MFVNNGPYKEENQPAYDERLIQLRWGKFKVDINGNQLPDKRTTRHAMFWEAMFEALEKFRAEHGHCNVPLNYELNPALGRWVTTQRFRKKIKALSRDRLQKLEDLGFIWSASDMNWEKMFAELAGFRERYGHCRIPSRWLESPRLSTWVSNQRYKRKTGELSPDRIRRLNEIGFAWSAVASKRQQAKKNRKPKQCQASEAVENDVQKEMPFEEKEQEAEPEFSDEKIFNPAPGVYIQFNDRNGGELPPQLRRFVQEHEGELPPFIPLPARHTVFLMGNPFIARRRKIVWPGHGRIDAEILEYVRENGVLPEQQER